jgi:hypothetical protein
MTTHYKLKVIKEIILGLETKNEAEQIADLLASRETSNFIGNLSYVYTEIEELENV